MKIEFSPKTEKEIKNWENLKAHVPYYFHGELIVINISNKLLGIEMPKDEPPNEKRRWKPVILNTNHHAYNIEATFTRCHTPISITFE